MNTNLSPDQREILVQFRALIDKIISPVADQWDREETIPFEVIQTLAQQGLWGINIPENMGGQAWDMMTLGRICEEIGRGSASLLSLFTVHGMVAQVLMKWGTHIQKETWLPKLAKGHVLGAFALTEPDIGSDARRVETTAVLSGDVYVLNGKKKWISCGQIAGLFLIVAQCDGKPSAFLVPKDTPGFSQEPIRDMLGFRSAMLASLCLENCPVPRDNMVGVIGTGFSHVAGTALDHGRYCIAWGSVGLAQACLEASVRYTHKRKQFGVYLKEHQLIQEMIANMVSGTKAARLLCCHAGYLKDAGDPDMIMETAVAKYFASQNAVKVALDAVQIHGANGCSGDYPVQRYLRDAKIMEIIEGSSQIQQILIAGHGYQVID
ncbi:MAG: acyl-CoA dehydrogenase family protein [Proteobacteria bacterium]|nr:acyl-CoA dehydrogenase family protein [Pseudomonadota bacterium]